VAEAIVVDAAATGVVVGAVAAGVVVAALLLSSPHAANANRTARPAAVTEVEILDVVIA
jgi:hypothetical protein